jgi:hypothetical protein
MQIPRFVSASRTVIQNNECLAKVGSLLAQRDFALLRNVLDEKQEQ